MGKLKGWLREVSGFGSFMMIRILDGYMVDESS